MGGEEDCLFRLLAPRLPGGGPLEVWLGPSSHEETEALAGRACLAAGGPGPAEEVAWGWGCPGPARDGQLAPALARPWVSAPVGRAGRPGGGWSPRRSQPLHRRGGQHLLPPGPPHGHRPLFWLQGALSRHVRPARAHEGHSPRFANAPVRTSSTVPSFEGMPRSRDRT